MCYLFNLYYKAFELKKKIKNKYVICGSILGWIENYLFNRQQKAEIDGFTSSTETVNAGFSLGFFFTIPVFIVYQYIINHIRFFAEDTSSNVIIDNDITMSQSR